MRYPMIYWFFEQGKAEAQSRRDKLPGIDRRRVLDDSVSF
jgi:hypothetical protein